MELNHWFNRLKVKFIRQPDMPVPAIQRLLCALDKTQDVELSCNDLNRLIDEYAEIQVRGEDAERLMPLVRQHLEICKECEEEFEALLDILENAATT